MGTPKYGIDPKGQFDDDKSGKHFHPEAEQALECIIQYILDQLPENPDKRPLDPLKYETGKARKCLIFALNSIHRKYQNQIDALDTRISELQSEITNLKK